jgi:hypothetical protein
LQVLAALLDPRRLDTGQVGPLLDGLQRGKGRGEALGAAQARGVGERALQLG